METSTTSTLSGNMFSTSSSDNTSVLGTKSTSSAWIYILILLAVFGVLYYVLSNSAEQEHLTMGTVTQLLSQDLQDVNLTGGPNGITDNLATGNGFQMYWNQPTRNGGNRANWSSIPIISQKSQQKMNELTSVNPSDLKLNNAPFPRIDPKSTVSPYPGIRNTLINQKEDEDYIEKELGKEMVKDQLVNNFQMSNPNPNSMRNQAMNTLQSALVNSCQSCSPGKCNNCPACQNGKMSYPRGDSVATNKVDAKSIGLLDNDFAEDYESVENFDSGVGTRTGTIMGMGVGSSVMSTKMHNKLCKKLVKTSEKFDSGMYNSIMSSKDNLSNASMDKFSLFADDTKENFDSGLNNLTHSVPAKLHENLTKKFVDKQSLFADDTKENFDSGVGTFLHSIPAKLHDNLTKKITEKQSLFVDDSVENFDSGIQHSTMPAKTHRILTKKLVRRQENFDSGLSTHTMPTKLHNKLTKKLVKKHENFDKNMIDLDNPLRASTGTCENCPQGRCINCPRRANSCPDSANCALGYPCKTCKTLNYLNDRDQIVDADNAKENFGCPCNRKNKIMTPTNLKQKYPDDYDNENFTKLIDNNSQKRETFQCSLNPDSTECNGCINECPCRLGNCLNCSDCRGETCKSCPNRRCPCLMGRCEECAKCRSGNCPMCPKNSTNNMNDTNNKANEQIEVNGNENFESVGFEKLCPCSANRCTNCPECRMGKCDKCPRSKETSNFIDLASLGTWHGGSRLGTNWNNATTALMSVDVNDTLTYYPDSYLGSYFVNPKFDIMKPYPVIPPSRTVGNLIVDSDN